MVTKILSPRAHIHLGIYDVVYLQAFYILQVQADHPDLLIPLKASGNGRNRSLPPLTIYCNTYHAKSAAIVFAQTNQRSYLNPKPWSNVTHQEETNYKKRGDRNNKKPIVDWDVRGGGSVPSN